jgi:hypothetical protein
MALRDKSFSLALLAWKRLNVHKTEAALHSEVINQQFGAALALLPTPRRSAARPGVPTAPEEVIAAGSPPPSRQAIARRAAFQLVGNLQSVFESLNANRNGASNEPPSEVK